MSELRLFADEGTLRPPGVHETVTPTPGLTVRCPDCEQYSLEYPSRCEAFCPCGYRWERAGQLHYSEPIPF